MTRSARSALSILLAAICVCVLGLAVHAGFERIRFRVVTTPQRVTEPSLAFPLPDLTPLAGVPVAIILRVTGEMQAVQLTVLLDSEIVGRLSLPAQRTRRVDLSVAAPAGTGHRLVLLADRPGWRLDSLQIGNVHGFSDGPLSFVIVPRNRGVDSPTLWLLPPLFIALVVARPRFEWSTRRFLQVVHRSAAGAFALLFASVLIAPAVSPYRVLFSLETFLLGLVILYVEPLTRSLRVLTPRMKPLVPHIAGCALFLGGVAQSYQPETGFTSLILFAERFQDRAVPAVQQTPHVVIAGTGHDGQFYAQLALDPLIRDNATIRAIDAPAYRSRRILLPWLAWAIGLGEPWFVLQAYALLNVVSWVLLAWLLLRWLPPGSLLATAAWAACLFGPGLRESVYAALSDGPSLLLLAIAIAIVERNRRWLATAVLALAGLARETNLLGGLGLAADHVSARPRIERFISTIVIVAPLLLWLTYLSSRGLPFWDSGEGGVALPFSSYIEKWILTGRGLLAREIWAWPDLLSLVALTTQALLLLRYREWRQPWWRVGFAYVMLLVVLGDKVWNSGDAAPRAVLPMTVAFNILLVQRFRQRPRTFWTWFACGNGNLLNLL